jgi:hypothetical protein
MCTHLDACRIWDYDYCMPLCLQDADFYPHCTAELTAYNMCRTTNTCEDLLEEPSPCVSEWYAVCDCAPLDCE